MDAIIRNPTYYQLGLFKRKYPKLKNYKGNWPINDVSFKNSTIKNHNFYLDKQIQNLISNSAISNDYKHHFIVIKSDKLMSRRVNLNLRCVSIFSFNLN